MSDSPTPLSLPYDLPFPLIITRILPTPNSQIKRGDVLLEYTFTSDTSRRALSSNFTSNNSGPRNEEEAKENDMVGTWEATIDGIITRWEEMVRPGSKVERKHAG